MLRDPKHDVADQDPSFQIEADPDQYFWLRCEFGSLTLMRVRIRTFQFDADPDKDPASQ